MVFDFGTLKSDFSSTFISDFGLNLWFNYEPVILYSDFGFDLILVLWLKFWWFWFKIFVEVYDENDEVKKKMMMKKIMVLRKKMETINDFFYCLSLFFNNKVIRNSC